MFEVHEFEGGGVGGLEDHGRGATGFESLDPAGDAEAPAVAGLEAGEIVFRGGGGQVVPVVTGELEERAGDHGADHVETVIAGAGMAIAIAVEAGEGFGAAGLEWRAEHVGRHRGRSVARR